MDIREKLVELLKTNACPSPFMCDPTCKYYGFGDCFPDRFADYLIAHGVTMQECKLGAKKTNADRIRNMNDEELAMCLYEIGYYRGWNALEGTLEWLRQPAEKSDKETVEEREDGDWNG